MKSIPQTTSFEDDMLSYLRDMALELSPHPGTAVFASGLHTIRVNSSEACSHRFDQPLAALTLQGVKRIHAGPCEFELTQGTMLVTSVDMPCVSRIIDATSDQPFLGLYIPLDRKILAELVIEVPHTESEAAASAWVEPAHLGFLDLFRRMTELAKNQEHMQVILPLVLRELHYLLLVSPNAAMLRQVCMNGRPDNRITEVIAWIRQNIGVTESMAHLAKMANMSVSSFHRHFKEITGSSPLQYQKKLRLYEAQRLMLAENHSAAEAALDVGYESITQFNREYKRMFGDPPGRDIAGRKRKLAD